MRTRDKMLLTGGVLGAVAVTLGLRKRPGTTEDPSSPAKPSGGRTDMPSLPGEPPKLPPRKNLHLIATTTRPPGVAVDPSALAPGWSTVGWYSYSGGTGHKFWIRIDKGPWTSGMLTSEQEWRWSVIEGNTPIATETYTYSQIDGLEYVADLLLLGWDGRAEDIMTMTLPRIAADWIDAAHEGTD